MEHNASPESMSEKNSLAAHEERLGFASYDASRTNFLGREIVTLFTLRVIKFRRQTLHISAKKKLRRDTLRMASRLARILLSIFREFGERCALNISCSEESVRTYAKVFECSGRECVASRFDGGECDIDFVGL